VLREWKFCVTAECPSDEAGLSPLSQPLAFDCAVWYAACASALSVTNATHIPALALSIFWFNKRLFGVGKHLDLLI
jgi:hypothetical protein